MKVGHKKWNNDSGMLCDGRILVGLKGKIYHMVVRQALLYGFDC